MNSLWWTGCLTLVLFGLLIGPADGLNSVLAEEQEPSITVVLDSAQIPQTIEATRLPTKLIAFLKALDTTDAGFAEVLAVYVVNRGQDPAKESNPPLSGRYKIDGTSIIFTPRHPLRPGLTYRAVLRVDDSRSVPGTSPAKVAIQREVTVPLSHEDQLAPPIVAGIYPSSDKLPENHLRFYIHFSKPMAHHEAYRNLELLDGSGQPIEAPFLELGEELWDPSGCRFTLLLDPGRVKHGLKPREELGPVLKAGSKYTLVVKQSWRDEGGQRLKSEFRKAFVAGPAIDLAIRDKDWKLTSPVADTRKPVIVEFDRVLDHALLARMLSVENVEGRPVSGKIAIAPGETGWRFDPNVDWKAGIYFLVIDTDLEDPAGNRIGRSFEVVRQKSVAPAAIDKLKRIRFEIRDAVATSSTSKAAED